jgi:hypothetical protein
METSGLSASGAIQLQKVTGSKFQQKPEQAIDAHRKDVLMDANGQIALSCCERWTASQDREGRQVVKG